MSLDHSPGRQALGRITGASRSETYPHPHLTTGELAERWRVLPQWVMKNWRRLGLRPIKVSSKLLFSIDQVEAAERASMYGEEK